MRKIFPVLVLAAGLAVPAGAATLTAVSATVNDVSGAVRATFSTGESITLRQAVNITGTGTQVAFTFKIQHPLGATVFTHSGNAAPGTAGGAQSQLAGIPISSFYSVPGQYYFVPETFLDTVPLAWPVNLAPVMFTISSPNITLVYPPNGARNLSDSPVTFRWAASGATRYRVTVSDNAGLYNPAHTGVNSGGNFYSYPANPSEPREQLVTEQVYYWKVEGLDAANNVISQSNIYNFSLKSQASSQTRNLAVTSLTPAAAVSDYSSPIAFRAVLQNTGSVTETNVSVRMTFGGMPASESPVQVASIGAGESRTVSFTAFMPADQEQSLAVACVDLFDDNIPDNCKTMLLSKNTGAAAAPGAAAPALSYEEMFQAILARLGPDAAAALEGYTFESLSCANCSQSELAAIITALISGDAQLVDASVTDLGGAVAASGSASAEASASETETSGEPPWFEAMELAETEPENREEWTGYTEALKTPEPAVYVIKNRKEWKKVWGTISSEEPPDLDFDKKMVAGIISTSADRATTVRLMGKRKTETGIAFDYYVIEAPAGEQPQFSAYIFKVFDKDEGKADFKRLDVGGK